MKLKLKYQNVRKQQHFFMWLYTKLLHNPFVCKIQSSILTLCLLFKQIIALVNLKNKCDVIFIFFFLICV